MGSTNSVKHGLGMAKDNIVDIVQFLVNWIAVPIIAVVILGLIVFFIGLAVRKHNRGDEYQDDIKHIVIAIIGLVLVCTFPKWGWSMVDLSPASFLITRMW